MENMGALVPNVCSLKELLGTVLDVENFVKGNSMEKSETVQEELSRWLKETEEEVQVQ